ncbi:MAG: hypothetical protein AAFR30_03280, partial [Cyanobacteria bacterium J06628_4]
MEQSLAILHKSLREYAGETDVEAVKSIQEQIRTAIPSMDTGGSLPQKKTPSGKTKVLHINYTRGQVSEPANTEMEHLLFFARTAAELGLRLEILADSSCREDIEQALTKEQFKPLEYEITESQN